MMVEEFWVPMFLTNSRGFGSQNQGFVWEEVKGGRFSFLITNLYFVFGKMTDKVCPIEKRTIEVGKLWK